MRILMLYTHAQKMPHVGTGRENVVSQVERLHSEALPGLGGRVCVVGQDFGNGRQPFFLLFSIKKTAIL